MRRTKDEERTRDEEENERRGESGRNTITAFSHTLYKNIARSMTGAEEFKLNLSLLS
jgi:hypothetical protein